MIPSAVAISFTRFSTKWKRGCTLQSKESTKKAKREEKSIFKCRCPRARTVRSILRIQEEKIPGDLQAHKQCQHPIKPWGLSFQIALRWLQSCWNLLLVFSSTPLSKWCKDLGANAVLSAFVRMFNTIRSIFTMIGIHLCDLCFKTLRTQ